MQHHVKKRSLGRTRNLRTALLRGLAISLIENGKIKTTEAKAKELRPYIERLITIAKVDSVSSRRIISSRLGEPKTELLKSLFETAAQYKERNGGYTRVIKAGRTLAGRDEAVIELV